jgi:type II secretory pathway component PulF
METNKSMVSIPLEKYEDMQRRISQLEEENKEKTIIKTEFMLAPVIMAFVAGIIASWLLGVSILFSPYRH